METAIAVRSDVSVSQTEVEETRAAAPESPPVLKLRLHKPKNDRKVEWREDTVDNEHMGKKKSKCCCIYKKPTKFGESSSEDDEECEHCFGHPEKRRKNRKKHSHSGGDGDEDSHSADNSDTEGESGSHKPAAAADPPTAKAQ